MIPAVKYLQLTNLKAMREAPTPQNVTELRAYYSKFFPNIAITLAPLYQLLCNNVKWLQTYSEAKAFQASITFDSLLVHYDTTKELT